MTKLEHFWYDRSGTPAWGGLKSCDVDIHIQRMAWFSHACGALATTQGNREEVKLGDSNVIYTHIHLQVITVLSHISFRIWQANNLLIS